MTVIARELETLSTLTYEGDGAPLSGAIAQGVLKALLLGDPTAIEGLAALQDLAEQFGEEVHLSHISTTTFDAAVANGLVVADKKAESWTSLDGFTLHTETANSALQLA